MSPASLRVLGQEGGRVGRNLDLGVVYKLYKTSDLAAGLSVVEAKLLSPNPDEKAEDGRETKIEAKVEIRKAEILAEVDHPTRTQFRFFEEQYAGRQQTLNLARIQQKAPLYEFKQEIEKWFFAELSKVIDQNEQTELREAWLEFFTEIDKVWVPDKILAEQNNIKKLWQSCFAKTSLVSKLPTCLGPTPSSSDSSSSSPV